MRDVKEKNPRICVIHGPNLNMLGHRDAAHYGNLTLSRLNTLMKRHAAELDLDLSIYQFNSEEKIIKTLHRQRNKAAAVIINPAAYTHYSIAIRDAIEILKIPVVEVHLSDIYARDDFRKISVTKEVCTTQFYGKHEQSYLDAIDFIGNELNK